MTQRTVTTYLASALAASGTLVVSYPSGTNAAWFQKGVNHKVDTLGGEFSCPKDFTIAFNAASMTLTWASTSPAVAAGSRFIVNLDCPGASYTDERVTLNPAPNRISRLFEHRITLGSPTTADLDGIATAMPTSGAVTLNGAALSGTKIVLDVPRNVTVDTVAGATFGGITITGTDVYGDAVIETIPANSGLATDAAGLKAFKEITAITMVATQNATQTAGTIGFGDVLGIPAFLPSAAFINAELQDGSAASAGTVVAGLSPQTKSTATTADVRGTYDPSAACDAVKAFELLVSLSDPNHKGNPQYSG